MGHSVRQVCIVAAAAFAIPLSGGLADVVPAKTAPAATPTRQEDKGQSNGQLTAGLRAQVSSLQALLAQIREQIAERKTEVPPAIPGGEQSASEQMADWRQPSSELHRALQSLIAQLREQMDLETQNPFVPGAERKDWLAAREAFARTLVELQQQDNELQQLMIGQMRAQTSVPSKPQPAQPASNDTAQPVTQGMSDSQAADLRKQITDLQRQLAGNRQELAQRTAELAQRTVDLEAARAELQSLRKFVKAVEEPHQNGALESQQQAMAQPAPSVASKPTTAGSTGVVISVPQPLTTPPSRSVQPASAQQATGQISTAPSITQQLQSARQWLSIGRVASARRLLATIQVQLMLQPDGPDHQLGPVRRSASDLGDAIRWLDLGIGDQAMRSIDHVIGSVESQDGAHSRPTIQADPR